jgi:hypothetical protein
VLYSQLRALGASITVIYQDGGLYNSQQVVEPVNLGKIMELPTSDWERHLVRECLKQDPVNGHWVESQLKATWALRLRQQNAT